MNVLLTSAGFENCKVSKVFLSFFAKDLKDIKVVFIPTAANSAESIAMLPKCMNDLLNIGIKSNNITVYDLHFKLQYRVLQQYDAVYICGGSTDYLMQRINKSGFRTVLLRYIRRNGVYVGVSAGSCIAANNVKSNLGLVNTVINVHCDEGEIAGPLHQDTKTVNLSNQQALLIKNKSELVVVE